MISKLRNFGKIAVSVFIALIFFCSSTKGLTVTTLGQGEVAPYKGYLFTPEAEYYARVAVIENDQYKMLTAEQTKALALAQQQINNKDNIIQTLKNKKDYDWYYFFGGMILGGYLVYEIKR